MTAEDLRKEFETKLKELQNICKHEETEAMELMTSNYHTYGWGKVCKSCEKVIE